MVAANEAAALGSNFTPAQVAHPNRLTRDLPARSAAARTEADGGLSVTIPLNGDEIVLITLSSDASRRGLPE